MDNDELIARESIRDLISRYTWCGEFLDVEGFRQLWTEDALLEIKGGASYQGREGVVSMITGGTRSDNTNAANTDSGGNRGEFVAMRHHVSSVRIMLDSAETARANSYFAVFSTPHGPDHWGRYSDKIVLTNGEWRFSHRRVSLDGAIVGSNMYDLWASQNN